MLSRPEILELLEHMLTRPMMYAQNPGSLEDQFTLLIRMLDSNETLFNEYLHFTRESGCGNCTLASKFSSFEELASKLKEFKRYMLHE